jgi:hypothetical protein
MSPAEHAAERAWDRYVVEARKRARMEGDPNFSDTERAAQHHRLKTAFETFREAFAAICPAHSQRGDLP